MSNLAEMVRLAPTGTTERTTPTDGALEVMRRHGERSTQLLAEMWQASDPETRAVLEWTDVFGEAFANFNIAAEKLANPAGMVWWARRYVPVTWNFPGECGEWFQPQDEDHLYTLKRHPYFECRQFPRGAKP